MKKIAKQRAEHRHVSTKLIQVWDTEMAEDISLTGLWLLVAGYSTLQKDITCQSDGERLQDNPCHMILRIRFVTYVAFNRQIDLNSLQPAVVANMDETPI